MEEQRSDEHPEFTAWMWKAGVALLFGVPLFIWGFIGTTEVAPGWNQIIWILIGLVTLFVLWYSGGHFFSGAWISFKAHRANMNTLIALATGPAWLYSFIISIWPTLVPETARQTHYDTAMTVIGLIIFGAALEMRASAKASASAHQLAERLMKHARIITAQQEKMIPTEDLTSGDIVQVQVNEIFPIDGVVVAGSSDVDQHSLTGTHTPVNKKNGDKIFAGTTNLTSMLQIKTTASGKNTALANIIAMIKQSQNAKPAIGKVADKIAAVFAPLVMIIALFTPLMWFNFGPAPHITYMLVTFMAILLIACPCALGLATPISITAGIGKAAESGVIFRKGDALQYSAKLTTLLLNQTGIISQSNYTLTRIQSVDNFPENQLLQYAASLYAELDNSLAKSLSVEANEAKLNLLPVAEQVIHSEGNVTGKINNQQMHLGDHQLMKKYDVQIPNAKLEQTKNSETQIDKLIYLAINQQCIGTFAFSQPIHPGVRQNLVRLATLNLKFVLLSRNTIETTRILAKQLDIDEYLANITTSEIVKEIQKRQLRGEIVAMVAHGTDDAEALNVADVGFALGSEAYAANNAGVTIINGSLASLIDSIRISRATIRNIKQNLGGALLYNIIGIPLAGGLFYPLVGKLLSPIIAGILMASSSLGVITNANRLHLLKSIARK